MPMPQRDAVPHLTEVDDLAFYFLSAKIALSELTVKFIKHTKLEEPLLAP
jgi:hypothetical protein